MVLTPFLCVLYGSRSKQRLLSYTVLTVCFSITEVESVYCMVPTESLYNTDDCLCFARNEFQHYSGAIGVKLYSFVKRD